VKWPYQIDCRLATVSRMVRVTVRGARFNASLAARGVLLALYLLASASFGFAHRFESIPAELAQLVLPDGTILPICGGKQDKDPGGHSAHRQVCDACCLTHAPGLPPSEGPFIARAAIAADDLVSASRSLQTFRAAVAHRPRGPPAA
jgi:hypothetical protein